MNHKFLKTVLAAGLLMLPFFGVRAQDHGFSVNGKGYFHQRGADVLVFNNWYSGYFSDSKLSGVEIIHHGVRTVTNGDVRLSNTPEQWDPIPRFVDRKVLKDENRVRATLEYPDYHFSYHVEAAARGKSVQISVILDRPLPEALAGRAGFNLEFLPSEYFGHTYLADGRSGQLPRHPFTGMYRSEAGKLETAPIDTGSTIVMAPEDPERRITIQSSSGSLALYDGRAKAQNGWYVVRSLIPAEKTGTVVQWTITPHAISDWTRKPVIAHSQVGYHPGQKKVAVIEMDPNDSYAGNVRLYRISAGGRREIQVSGQPVSWGRYQRYDYARFDFSEVTEPGVYVLEFEGVTTSPFRISGDVYAKNLWQSTLDTFMPVQMDHMLVNDRYRVWHGASHLDDALQAPVDHEHFDLYRQGPTTDSPYRPGQHIPGLNRGGWYDAGDFDIRTQSQYAVVSTLVDAYETFGITWDETTVEQPNRYVDLHRPDGTPDILQQIEHGTLQLLSQYLAVGHAINGIIVPTIGQYTHMGDGLTQTDNHIFSSKLDSLEVEGNYSGRFDDRWAFTSKSTPLDYGSIAALAGASRVLRGYNDTLATRSLQLAERVWKEEHAREPVIFQSGNTAGGPLKVEEMKAAVALLKATNGEQQYAERIKELWPYVRKRFAGMAGLAVEAMPFMDSGYRQEVRQAVVGYKKQLDQLSKQNPFGVPVSTGGWGGSGSVLHFAMQNYQLHQAFPELIGPEYVLRGVDYILGTHPASSVSLVSGIGSRSKTVAYGNNRADYSFIPGGVIPGVVIVKPDFPELKKGWPFLWYENEYVINEAALWIYAGNAANSLMKE